MPVVRLKWIVTNPIRSGISEEESFFSVTRRGLRFVLIATDASDYTKPAVS